MIARISPKSDIPPTPNYHGKMSVFKNPVRFVKMSAKCPL
jgi:hypothetical protein